MKSLLMGLAALPFVTGVAIAGQPLTDQQMDQVTAGFTSTALADALGTAGESGVVYTAAATLAQVNQYAAATLNEHTSILYKSLSGSQSTTLVSSFTPMPIPAAGP